jgi:hypothetical protein
MGNENFTEKANKVWDFSLDGEDGSVTKYRLTTNKEGKFEYSIEISNSTDGSHYEKVTEYNGTYTLEDKKIIAQCSSKDEYLDEVPLGAEEKDEVHKEELDIQLNESYQWSIQDDGIHKFVDIFVSLFLTSLLT